MMFPLFVRRHSFLFRCIRIALILLTLFTAFETLSILHTVSRPAHSEPSFTPLRVRDERIFIASIHWNVEALLRSYWLNALTGLIEQLGHENVYVSVQESGSYDNTKGALQELDAWLEQAGVQRTIVLDETSHIDVIGKALVAEEEGWIQTPKNGSKPRRIPFLAAQRNVAMRPLYEMQKANVTFDKILFLNDVVFTPEDVRELLATNGGSYAAACSLDFSRPPAFYDTFALRDVEGHEAVMQTWPYFGAAESRQAIKANQPARVASCWNGMVVMDTTPFYSSATPQLVFRGIPDSLADSRLEGSECCLIHADNPASTIKGVWLNPKVRVGYNPTAYEKVHPASTFWVSTSMVALGTWANRLARWTSYPWLKEHIVRGRVAKWEQEAPQNKEVGEFCLINEMQVLSPTGWAHV